MEWIDTHTHLYLPQFENRVEDVLAAAQAAGITRCITLGIDVATSRQAIALAEQFPMVWAAVGIHPSESAKASPADIQEIARLAQHPRVVAIGEIGMDFYWKDVPPEPQYRVFEAMVGIAQEQELPVVIHSRQAVREIEWFLQELGIHQLKGQMHCFEAEPLDARFFLEMGCYISFGGNVTYKGYRYGQTVKTVPVERLLLETDSPYLTPLPHRGQPNQPAFLPITAQKIAEMKGVPLATLAEITTRNARQLFWGDS